MPKYHRPRRGSLAIHPERGPDQRYPILKAGPKEERSQKYRDSQDIKLE